MKMIVTDIGCHPLSKKITLFVGSILLTNIVTAHKCFVCGPNTKDDNVENNGVLIPTCDHFNPKNPIFIRECKPETKACNIQTNGTILTRTCELRAIVDCKIANHVEYCYCGPELCNKYHPNPNPTHEDEEEDEEGSGTERQFVTDVTSVLQVPDILSTVPTTASSTVTMHGLNINILLIGWVLLVFLVSCDM